MNEETTQPGLTEAASGADQGTGAGSTSLDTAAAGNGAGTTAPAPSKPAALDLSDETVRRLATGLAGALPQQPAGQTQPQLSPEQLDEMLKVVKLDPAEVAGSFGLTEELSPKAHAFMEKLVKAIVTHVNVVSDVRQRLFEQRHISPMRQFMEQAQNKAYEAEFFETFPNLKPHAKIARLVYANMIQQGARFSTPQEAYTAIAKQTTELVGATGGGNDNNGDTGDGASAKMPTISMGGRASGATTQRGQQGATSEVKALFG